ncbi:monocarboxylate transporter 3 [Nematostella vectensis]|nr:monocarboxylate transporter 3 [Nematostella vectensis]XP_048585795.1 monocarboxylate transporter 3 [Nematostella vectensis]XP_048585796.1 monocarboxylate transporter 3 [Nematostella vectensis]XP_048585797.1 monocarboxylate transporter 3 [Nematostella vectensis]
MPCCFTRGAPPRPRDGPWAWLVCFSAAIMNFMHFGFSQSFGVFLPVLGDYFNEDKEKTAWVGSIAIAFTFLMSPVAVRMSQRFGLRLVTMCSGALLVISLVTSSFVEDLVYLYFSYGVLFGIGASSILSNSFLVCVWYFSPGKRSLAMGIAASGGSIGIMAIGPTMQALIDSVGWRNAFRAMAAFASLVCVLGATYDPNVEHRTVDQRPRFRNICEIVDISVYKNSTYTIGTITVVLAYFGFFIPNLHIVRYAEDLLISGTKASQLFIYMGICSTVFRVFMGRLLDLKWLTPLQGVQVSALIMGLSIIALGSVSSYYHFVIFAVFFGSGSGAFVITQAVMFQTSLETKKSAIGLGMGYFCLSVTVVSGAPTVGFIADQLGSYIPSFYVIGGILLFAAVFPCALYCYRFLQKKGTEESVHESDETDWGLQGLEIERLIEVSRETVL